MSELEVKISCCEGQYAKTGRLYNNSEHKVYCDLIPYNKNMNKNKCAYKGQLISIQRGKENGAFYECKKR